MHNESIVFKHFDALKFYEPKLFEPLAKYFLNVASSWATIKIKTTNQGISL